MSPEADESEAYIAELGLHGGFGGINPTEDQLRAVMAGPDGPVQMINLLKFHDRAEYPEDYDGGEDTDVSGEDAYGRYAANTLPLVDKHGGRLVLLGVAGEQVIAAPGEWDQVAIVEYPNREAFLAMGRDPDYVAGTVHRTAGLERTALLATTPVIDASNPG